MERDRPGRVAIAVAALVVGTVTCGPALEREDLDCMEALDHLIECCPGVAIDHSQCDRDTTRIDACGGVHRPATGLSSDESACSKRKSCAQLVADNTCTTAAKPAPHSLVPQCR